MDIWRKNVAAKHSRRTSTALPLANKRSSNKENRVTLKANRKSCIDSPSSRGSRWLSNKGHANRKSITRRLSFPKHDDSISLLNFEDAEKSITKIPGRQEIITISSVKDRNNAEECPRKSPLVLQNCFTSVSAQKMLISKETMEYLKKEGLLNTSSNKKPISSPMSPPMPPVKEVVESHHCDKSEQIFNSQKDELPRQSEVQFGAGPVKVDEVLSRHCREREELRRRHMKEMEDLEKQHEKQLKDIFHPASERNLPEPTAAIPIVKVTNESLQNLSLLQDSLLRTPTSGTWLVSEEFDRVSANNTPTLGLNDMTLNGRQQFMETPATRRLVTQRILQGIESLFV